MVTPQCSLGQNKWTLSEAEARGEQRMRADALREEGGRGRKWERYIICTSAMAPISCLFTWIFIFCTLPFLHQSIHLSFYLTPLHTHSHTHIHTRFIPVMVWTSHVIISPLLLYLPSPSPFNIKPLTLCGKWAHSPIQCLLRHGESEFHIKTVKAGLGCRSGELGRSNARCRLDVWKERAWIQYRDDVCASWTELKFTEDAVANNVWGGGRSIAGSWGLRACGGN